MCSADNLHISQSAVSHVGKRQLLVESSHEVKYKQKRA